MNEKNIIKKVSQKVRQAEDEIDQVYKSNLLLSIPYITALWHLLVIYEDIIFLNCFGSNTISRKESSAMCVNLNYGLKTAINWLKHNNKIQGSIPPLNIDPILYDAAVDLLSLALDYQTFVIAFTYASRGLINIHLQEKKLIHNYNLNKESQYEAYNELIKLQCMDSALAQIDLARFNKIQNEILRAVKFSGNHFQVKTTPSMIQKVMAFSNESIFSPVFKLPENWKFDLFTLDEFRTFFLSINTLAMIHSVGRFSACGKGCENFGRSSCIIIFKKEELIQRLIRYTKLDDKIIKTLIELLTFGSYNLNLPDPALQPIIPLTDNLLAISPLLWTTISPERNLCALLNRIPYFKTIYSGLTLQKETLMRNNIKNHFSKSSFKFWNGKIPGNNNLPDIDLVIISHEEKACLVTELKWFIPPAEVREIIERSEEIHKGVEQIIKLQKHSEEHSTFLPKELHIDNSYEIFWCVISANSIGMSSVQSKKVPVISEEHFISMLKVTKSIKTVGKILKNREYLPVVNQQYEIDKSVASLEGWELNWYNIILKNNTKLAYI